MKMGIGFLKEYQDQAEDPEVDQEVDQAEDQEVDQAEDQEVDQAIREDPEIKYDNELNIFHIFYK